MLRVVQTENGLVRGIPAADPRVTSFKGIPFAAPPVGVNRWRSPQPCPDWQGELDCARFAPISMQETPGIGDVIYNREWHVDPEIPMSEDCLYLNVWTGAKSADEKQPVLVWFFGGGLQYGYPAEMEFDGERLARRGIVVVSVNYRIGVLGYMAHPQLTREQPEAPANFGSLDQQAGLRWVKRNIARFGGDPDNVTIAGQSAGGGSVLSQIGCKANAGLFHRAVVMSAMIRDPYGGREVGRPEPLADAEKNGAAFLRFIGANNLEEARAMDAAFIRDRYAEYMREYRPMFTVLDGKFCTGDPLAQYLSGDCVDVPMMAGNTADEFPNGLVAVDEASLPEAAEACFGAEAQRFLGFEESRVRGEAGFGTVNGIGLTVRGVFERKARQGMKNYYYRFDADIPGWDHPGTFHSVDLWFFFETLAKCWRPFVGRHYDLSRQMCNYWANFIRSGDPNGTDADGTPMPTWQPYSQEAPWVMTFTGDGPSGAGESPTPFERFLIDRVVDRI